MLEDFRLKVFEKVAELGSFTAAAKELNVSQPAVSQNIAELEKTLGEQLFTRERGSVSLTDKGRLFKGYADQILHWYRVADEAFHLPTVFDPAASIKTASVPLGKGKEALIWGSQGDLHISIKEVEED